MPLASRECRGYKADIHATSSTCHVDSLLVGASMAFIPGEKALSPRLKIERAEKHIRDLDGVLSRFLVSGFYSVRVEGNQWQPRLHIDIDTTSFPSSEASVILGDAIHNLRSSLDILVRQALIFVGGAPTKYTKFPITNEREELVARVNGGLEEQGGHRLSDLLLDEVKSYQAGNYPLWALHQLDIADKHQAVIPLLKILRFSDIELEDRKGNKISVPHIFTEASCSYPIDQIGVVKLKDMGTAAAALMFPLGVPFECDAVIPRLHDFAKAVGGIIESFETILGTKF